MEVQAAAPRPASPSATENMFAVFRGVGRDLMAAEQGHDAAVPNTLEQLLKRIKALEQEVQMQKQEAQMQKQEIQMQADHARDLDYKHSHDLDAEKQRRVDQALRLDTERKTKVGMFMLRVRVNKKVRDRAHANFLKRQEAAAKVNKFASFFLARLQERNMDKATKIQASVRGALASQPERLKTLRHEKQQLDELLTTTTNERDTLRRENDRMRLRHDREVEALQQRHDQELEALRPRLAMLAEENNRLEQKLAPFLCPINHEVPEDPVICACDGRTYERASILQWVQENHTSPMTREQVDEADLLSPQQANACLKAVRLMKLGGLGSSTARELRAAGLTLDMLKRKAPAHFEVLRAGGMNRFLEDLR